MKNTTLSLILFVGMLLALPTRAQERNQSQPGFKVFDRFGTEYAEPPAPKQTGTAGKGSAATVLTPFCTVGYFELYCEPGTWFDGNTAAQTVVCELFDNLSGLIYSPLTATGAKARIYFTNYTGPMTSALAFGTSFYIVPNASTPPNLNPGIAENQLFKTIMSGVDAYANLPQMYAGYIANQPQYFHAQIAINPSQTWYSGLSTGGSGDYDLYSIMLHEVTHTLGFLSLMNANGGSNFGSNLNYYSSYDKFLHTSTGVPLLSNSVNPTTCPNTNLAFTVAPSNVQPGSCPSGITNSTTCSTAVQYISAGAGNIPVYTPNCFEPGSSLSHFEDLCYTPGFSATGPCYAAAGSSNNDLYWVMSNSNSTGSCYLKRYLKPLERQVLCDLGYSVNVTYTSNATSAPYNYGGVVCPGRNIFGVDDGFNGTIYTHTTTLGSISIPTTVIAGNDAPSTAAISCVESIYNNATAVVMGGNLVVTAASGYHGLALIKYFPETSGGVQGNATYVYVYFVPTGCSPTGMCSLVQNGNFESVTYGPSCNYAIAGPNNLPNVTLQSLPGCWESYWGQGSIIENGCSSPLNLGTDVYGAAINSYNGTPNNHVVGLAMQKQGFIMLPSYLVTPPSADVLKNNLSTPMIPGNTYQISFLVSNFGSPVSNSNAQPVVVTVASAPVFNMPTTTNYPAGLNVLAQVTIPATSNASGPWTAITQTFVFSGASPHSALMIGGNVNATFLNYNGANTAYLLIDEVSLQPLPTPTFVLPQVCGSNVYTNLMQYVTTTGGVFTGTNVTLSGTQYDFNWINNLPPGNYPIGYTTSNGTCLNTVWQNIVLLPPYTLTASANNMNCQTYNTNFTVTAGTSPAIANMTYVWTPGSIPGNPLIINSTSSQVFTVTATDPAGCTSSLSIPVTVITNCCNLPNIPQYNNPNVNGAVTLTGPMRFPSSFNVFGILTLTGEFIISPNVQITVQPGGQLILRGAHLRACAAMWTGIHVRDGARVIMQQSPGGVDNLVEDAIIALNVPVYLNTSLNMLQLSNTTFNKNRTSINIINYPVSATQGNGVSIMRCVFSGRDYNYTTTTWPQTSFSDLRNAPAGTAVLYGPYPLQSAPKAQLRSPWSSTGPLTAIQLSDVGTTTGSTNPFNFTSILIGNQGDVTFFNLFDGHEHFIVSSNSNVNVENCVFQNTDVYLPSPAGTINAAISATAGVKNTQVSLYGPNTSRSCRFYDCHDALIAQNVYNLTVDQSIFRSTRLKTDLPTATTLPRGQSGIYVSTNRIYDYVIQNNEFTAIDQAMSFYMTASTFTGQGFASPTVTNYINSLSVVQNTASATLNFASTAPTNNFLRRGLIMASATNQDVWSTTGQGIEVIDNLFYRVFTGIEMNGINSVALPSHPDGPNKLIAQNRITLEQNDITPGAPQWGIYFIEDKGGSPSVPGNSVYCLHSIEQNSVTLLSALSITSSAISLIGCVNNTGGTMRSPYVICNTLSNAYRGFYFNNSSPMTYWRGNKMQSLKRGMELDNNAVIGNQGTATAPSDNQWNGTWTGNFGTWVNSSDASLSMLYINPSNGVNFQIPTFGSNVAPALDYVTAANRPAATGAYVCGGSYNQRELGEEALRLNSNWQISVSPNPASGEVRIRSNHSGELLHIRATDMSGRTVLNTTVSVTDNNASLSLPLANGLYILSFDNGSDPTRFVKIVIAK